MTNLRFAAWSCIVLYGVLLFSEYLRPTFVSATVNVHSVLLIALLLIFATIVFERNNHGVKKYSPVFWNVFSVFFGALLGLIAWKLGADFGVVRFWFAVAIACTPVVFLHVSK